MTRKIEIDQLWEGSHFLSAEHIDLVKKEKLFIRVEDMATINSAIAESYWSRSPIIFILFDAFNMKQISGTVTQIDQGLRRVKLKTEDDCEWIRMDDIARIFR
ncbi:MAG: hypothetical protein JWM44_1716 [Bacilli bacterium]|nr:hypothetical protein [Bacilli bacterium]